MQAVLKAKQGLVFLDSYAATGCGEEEGKKFLSVTAMTL